MKIKRIVLQKILRKLFHGKAILLLGARQTGKTTILKYIFSKFRKKSLFLNCDEASTRTILSNTDIATLSGLLQDKKIILIDEAQRVENIGITLKLLVDNFPNKQVIASGSSAFFITSLTNEPFTGRKFEYILYPISFEEMAKHTSIYEEVKQMQNRIIYGYYPEIITTSQDRKELLTLLANSYLYKDILTLNGIHNANKIEKLLQAIALQIGSEVNTTELASLTGLSKNTVNHYLDILEKSFVIIKIRAFSRNPRNELKKRYKIYFIDNGIRNAIINNFNPIDIRTDKGPLWENFLISERLKYLKYHHPYAKQYFWRTHYQSEIDYVEERDNKLYAYEFKWHKGRTHFKAFKRRYPNAITKIVTPANFWEFITA